MSTLSKESTEALNSTAAESPASQSSKPQSSAAQLHSDAVSLEVPLKVHGSKVTEVVRGAAPHTEPFEEETSSMIVFPHGGVLRMSTSVNAGQMLVLTNLKSRQDAICRVVKVRSYSNSSSYIEVEFTHRQPGFWGVYFESDAVAAATPPATPASTETPAKSPRQTEPGASAPKGSGLDKNESTFIAIGSQEDVQPAASSTSVVRPSLKTKAAPQDSKSFQKPGTPTLPPSSVASVPSSPSQAHKTQQEEEDASLETLGEAANAAALPTGGPRAARNLAGEAFGSRLDSTTESAQTSSEGKKNWLLIAACAAALLAAAGAAVLFSHHKSPDSPVARIQVPASPSPSQNQTVQVAPPQVTVPPSIPKPNFAPPAASRTAPAPVAKSSVVVTESPAEPAPSAPAAPVKKAVPSVLGALNSHPIAARKRADGIMAPTVDSVAAPSGDALAGITSSANLSTPTLSSSLRVSAPVQSGNGTREPKLLVRVIPQYPPLARQTHTEGDVVLQIAVDRSGNVTEAKVLSGPAVLHMAAIGAVKRWKYESVDGPASLVNRMTVTIQFRL
jgi:TonB family protein